MSCWTKWSSQLGSRSVVPLHHSAPAAGTLLAANQRKHSCMPTRGYRKGMTDAKEPLPRQVFTRISTADHAALHAEADTRSMNVSALVRLVLKAHLTGKRVELPHPERLTDAFLRQYARLGNNLNQLLKQAHLMRLPLIERDVRDCLAALEAQAKHIRR